MCARASAFRSSNSVRRRTTSRRNSMKLLDELEQVQHARPAADDGQHDDAERRLQLRVLVEVVEDDLGTSPRFSSITIRMPSRSDSSRRSEMPSIVFSRTRSAIFSIRRFLLTWYGISVTTIDGLSPFFDCLDRRSCARISDRAAAGRVRLHDALAADDDAAGGEVGPGTMRSSCRSRSRASSIARVGARLAVGVDAPSAARR